MNQTQTATNNPDVITRDEAINRLKDRFHSSRNALIAARARVEAMQRDLVELEEEYRWAVVAEAFDRSPTPNAARIAYLVALRAEFSH